VSLAIHEKIRKTKEEKPRKRQQINTVKT